LGWAASSIARLLAKPKVEKELNGPAQVQHPKWAQLTVGCSNNIVSFNAFDAMLLAAIEIHPVACPQDSRRGGEQYRHPATQAVERRLPGNIVRRDYGASMDDEMDRLKGPGFDESGGVVTISVHTQA
jgi:hypothetical protein